MTTTRTARQRLQSTITKAINNNGNFGINLNKLTILKQKHSTENFTRNADMWRFIKTEFYFTCISITMNMFFLLLSHPVYKCTKSVSPVVYETQGDHLI